MLGRVVSNGSRGVSPSVAKDLSRISRVYARFSSSFLASNPSLHQISSPSLKREGCQNSTTSRRLYSTEEAGEKKNETVEEADFNEVQPEAYVETESVVGDQVEHQFQAETKKLLDIVARSLYTDSEIFVRELISNASDALEKFRHTLHSGAKIADEYLPPEIHIHTDSKSNTLIIQDYGIGMTKDDLMNNLGTIARSGTSDFVKKLEQQKDAGNLIGQFGVGFYSAFMVADEVRVYTRSAIDGQPGYLWTYDGTGAYSIAEASNVSRGTKIIIHLKPECSEFAEESTVRSIISKYSNFVNFDIKLNGEKVNTIQALWTKNKSEVTPEEHAAFYKFISHDVSKPMYTMHFQTDTPLKLSCLFYVPKEHSEKYGFSRMEPGVSLYCKKVLIQSEVKNLLPEYLRFVRGVVDCEDIPLNLSREHLQDSALIARLGNVLVRRFLKFLAEEAKRDPEAYEKFYAEFGNFLKEGLAPHNSEKEQIAKLLRMESSNMESGKLTSFEEYVERMQENQEKIYYLVAPKRNLAESSPYFEHFKKKGTEVLFLYTAIDDWVMHNLSTFSGKKLQAIDSETIQPEEDAEEENVSEEDKKQTKEFTEWIKDELHETVFKVVESKRLSNSPAMVVDDMMAINRLMMIADKGSSFGSSKKTLEINPKHPIIINLKQAYQTSPDLSKAIIRQIYDNALISAGLLDEPREMLGRLNQIIEAALTQKKE